MNFDQFTHTLAVSMIKGFGITKAVTLKLYLCLILATKGFKTDNATLRASALTFYSLLSIVPVMAMAFGIAKGFGFEKVLKTELLNSMAGQEAVALKIIDFAEKLLSETQGGIVAALGVMLLGWTVVRMLNHMELAFNEVWRIKQGRSLMRKFSDYIALAFTAPILVIFASSVTVYIKARLTVMLSQEGHFEILESTIPFFLKLLPFATMCILFIFIYLFIPNRRMNMKATVAGGTITGVIYQTGQLIYINSQVGVSHYNAIYGSFAALPLFLVWLQMSWSVVLLGAHFAYAWEHAELLKKKEKAVSSGISFKMKKIISLAIVLTCVRRFAKNAPPPADEEIASDIDMPIALVRSLLDDLKKCAILSQVATPTGNAWQPARDIHQLTIASVVQAMEEQSSQTITVSGSLDFEALMEAVESMASIGKLSAGTRLLKDI